MSFSFFCTNILLKKTQNLKSFCHDEIYQHQLQFFTRAMWQQVKKNFHEKKHQHWFYLHHNTTAKRKFRQHADESIASPTKSCSVWFVCSLVVQQSSLISVLVQTILDCNRLMVVFSRPFSHLLAELGHKRLFWFSFLIPENEDEQVQKKYEFQISKKLLWTNW